MRSLLALLVGALGATLAATPSHATPITYAFSMRVTSFLSADDAFRQQNADAERAYLLAHPGEATPGWSGTLAYDSDTGLFTVDLIAPFGAPGHPVQLGGVAAASFVGDLDLLDVPFASGDPYPRYFSRTPGDVFSWYGTSRLVLASAGLIAGGELRHGLTGADLGQGYLWGEGSPFDTPSVMHSFGCPQTETLLECAYDGYYHYEDNTQTVLMSIAELHEIPEASVSSMLALALLGWITSRLCGRASAS